MKILITGSNGMLGSTLCYYYHNKYDIFAFHRDNVFYSLGKDYSIDLTNFSKVDQYLDQIEPDVIIHCAGLTNVDKCEISPKVSFDVNVRITENIARKCSNKTQFIYISSDQVYGNCNDNKEKNTKIQPINQYGRSKLAGEKIVSELCEKHIIIRTNIFGWNFNPNKTSSAEWIYNSLNNKQEITLYCDYTFSPIYTFNLAAIIIKLIKNRFYGIINIGSPKPCSKYEFGIVLAREFGLDQSLIKKGFVSENSFVAQRPKNLELNTEKLSALKIRSPNYNLSIKHFSANRSDGKILKHVK